MRIRNRSVLSLTGILSLVGLLSAGVYAQDGDQQLMDGFLPYRNGSPQIEGITPGMTLTKENVQLAEKVLPPEIVRVVQAGDFEIPVQATTDFPILEAYMQASIKHAGQVQLGADGELQNYTLGQPFPRIDPADPQAGLKAAWNYRMRYMGDTMTTQGVLRTINSSGNTERAVDTRYSRRYGMFRPNPEFNVAKWEKEGTWWREHSIVMSPQDLEGAQSLTFHYAADTTNQKGWAYDPQSRRTRSIVVNHHAASFEASFLIEDHAGFQGYLHNYTWQYLGEQVALVPGFIGGTPPEYGGKSGWYPQSPWELRQVVVLEATSNDSGHPYGKRRLYIDRQIYSVFCVFVYDHEGTHWRTLLHTFGDPADDPDNAEVKGTHLHLGNVWIDYKSNSAALWTADEVLINKPLKPRKFTVKEMVRLGK